MLNWLRGKPEITPVTPPNPPAGVFSTHRDLMAVTDRNALQEQVARANFQTGIALDAAIDQDGRSIAMDSAGYGKMGLQSFGNTISDAQLAWYGSQSFIGFQTCALLMQHWFIAKACEMPAKDAIRNGWEITVNDGTEVDPAILDKIRQRDKFYRLKHNAVEFIRMGRGFGIRIAMPVIVSTDPLYYEKPYNPDGTAKGSYKGITQIDPYWISPLLDGQAATSPGSIGFYEPTYWNIPINGVTRRVHKSHLIIMRNGELPDILKPTYLYGGVSVPQKLVERVYAAERTANEAPMLALSKRSTVLHLDVAQALANETKFSQRMTQWMGFLNNFGVKVVGTEEKIEQFDTALADMDELIKCQYALACAIAEVPITRMMGENATGLNATGEGDEANYHEFLESLQEHDGSPLLERHYECLIRSEFGGKFDVTIRWNELDAMTAQEQAQTNKVRADTYAILAQTGAIDGQDIRDKLIQEPESGFNGLKGPAPLPDDDEELAESISKDELDIHPRGPDGKFVARGTP